LVQSLLAWRSPFFREFFLFFRCPRSTGLAIPLGPFPPLASPNSRAPHFAPLAYLTALGNYTPAVLFTPPTTLFFLLSNRNRVPRPFPLPPPVHVKANPRFQTGMRRWPSAPAETLGPAPVAQSLLKGSPPSRFWFCNRACKNLLQVHHGHLLLARAAIASAVSAIFFPFFLPGPNPVLL